jgi:ribosome maturation factor RimP
MVTPNWAEQIAETVEALGFELVELQYGAGRLLRVAIDTKEGERLIQIDDCEQVSRQLSALLNVIDLDYARLEVSSPGLDRLLTKPSHVSRFMGSVVSLSLKEPVREFARRRHFDGVLIQKEGVSLDEEVAILFVQDSGDSFELIVRWNEIQELRLKPQLAFGKKDSTKGKRK